MATQCPQDFREIVRKELGDRSRNWLAMQTSIPQPTINRWLGGTHRTISSEHLASICAVLGLKMTSK